MRILAKPIGLPLAILAAAGGFAALPAAAQTMPAGAGLSLLQLNTGRGRLVTLDAPITNVFVANENIADVQVRSPTQIYIFAKNSGETSVHATTKTGKVIYAATIRVGNNIDSIDAMLHLAMPEAQIVATPMNGLILLTGTIATPADAAEAERLVQAFVGKDTQIISRLRTATPLQVNLQVRFAEVSRSFVKDIGVNMVSRDQTSGMQFGVSSGSRVAGTIGTPSTANFPVLDASSKFGFPAGTISLPFDPQRGDFVYPGTGSTYAFNKGTANTALGLAGKLLGLDILGSLDLGERIGQVTTLTNPNLTALSGETSTFLAGGEIPILVSQGLGAVSVEYKQYGVSLAYTPTVLSDGRISLRVKPEVSSLSSAGAVNMGGNVIPALTTRRAETTVELGSGESIVIAGLMQNNHNNSIDKAPGLGDVPVLGALFRSNSFQRNETELVIVITPYLVKPVNANQIALPTDGYKAPDDFQRVLGGQLSGSTDRERPKPSMANPSGEPSVGAMSPAPLSPAPMAPASRQQDRPVKAQPPRQAKSKKPGAAAAPGFGF
ncbi:MAG: type II and III secretion system protein family protein [Sphingomonas sp.]|uniref:type II and III secretion system protein family protein n=1 Tax=Sphingomonas sp. TaxID=28214 RepID=UPI0025D90C41|nr:type II and III secretion system protein family protein [Sphingomonas sp.]MBX3566233.1 type II and III secretion system protein family protein [Sphingomonas sp.]